MFAPKVVILSIGFYPNIGGLETHLTELTDELAKHLPVLVVTLPPISTRVSAPMIEHHGNLTIWRIPWFGKGLFYKFMSAPFLNFLYLTPPLFFGLLLALVKYPSVKVIHSQGISALLTGAFLGKLFGKRIIVSTHYIYGFKQDFFSKFTAWVYGLSDRVLCVSTASRREMLTAGIPDSKLGKCAYWVNLDTFTPRDKIKSKHEVKWPDKFSVLFIGRLVAVKGIDRLISAIPALSPDINVYIIGDGPLKNEVAQAAQKYSNLHFLGKVDNHLAPNYFNAADVVVVPSIQETLGRVSMEAMACATPVVASATDGIKEVVNDRVGILINPTPDEISSAVNLLHSDHRLYARLKSHARDHVRRYFSPDNVKIFIHEYGLDQA